MAAVHADGVTFVGINVQDSEAAARDYIDDLGVTYPNGRDEDGTITVDYGVVGLPVTFFIGSGGIVERRWVGNIPESRVSSWVEDLTRRRAQPRRKRRLHPRRRPPSAITAPQ